MRPITLFTGQWADLPLKTMAQKAAEWGYQGLELAASGDHLDIDKAATASGFLTPSRRTASAFGRSAAIWRGSSPAIPTTTPAPTGSLPPPSPAKRAPNANGPSNR